MRISINEILVIFIIIMIIRILRDPDSMPLQRLQRQMGAAARIREKEDSERARAEEESRRRNTRCHFRDGFRASEFEWMVRRAGRYLPWITQLEVSGPMVYGVLESESGQTNTNFSLDFNDYGHITGRYWISQTGDSDLPVRLAAYINRELEDWKSGASRKAYLQTQRNRRRSLLRRLLPVLVIVLLLMMVMIRVLSPA